jgi:hypothetical protein
MVVGESSDRPRKVDVVEKSPHAFDTPQAKFSPFRPAYKTLVGLVWK